MRVLQLNLNHCEAAQELLTQTVIEQKVDIAILSEQYRNLGTENWSSDQTKKAAVWACGCKPFQSKPLSGQAYYTRAKICGINFYSCYIPPSVQQNEYERILDNLVRDIANTTTNIVAGDFNAWAIEWGSTHTNRRGDALLKAFSTLDIVLLNTGNKNTFEKNGRGSIIDITFASSSLVRKINWQVSDIYTHSDHLALLIEIDNPTPAKEFFPSRKAQTRGWKVDTLDEDVFKQILDSNPNNAAAETEQQAEDLIRHISKACDAAMCRKRQGTHRKSVYWWNDEIEVLRSECHKARRLCQRRRQSTNYAVLQECFKRKRNDLKKAIKGRKASCFKELCNKLDENPWGDAYRIVMTKVRGHKGQAPTCPKLLKTVVETLFPAQPAEEYRLEENGTVPTPITDKEVLEAAERFANNKASGLDGIPNKALKIAIKHKTDPFTRLFAKCLREGLFPKIWKIQRLVLIQKPNKPPGEPNSYRPLCMLDAVGKILERIISVRLEQHLEKEQPGLADNQYGFRRHRSTIDAIKKLTDVASKAIEGTRWMYGSKEYCAVVTFDVKNAFNSAYWPHIIRALQLKKAPPYLLKIISNYLSDRVLIYDTDEGPQRYRVTGGVPQGSVLGPLLWNILYDGVLRLPLPKQVQIIGYADDIAVTVVAKEIHEIVRLCNHAAEKIKEWLMITKLQLAGQKTEAVLITSRKKLEVATLNIDGYNITTQQSLRYLGVMIDSRLRYKTHIDKACEKASRVTAALTRIMANIGGPSQNRRVLLAKVSQSILMYAAPIWGIALQQKTYAEKAKSIVRLNAIRVACAYRTVSHQAAGVISGLMPPDIMAMEIKRVFDKTKSTGDRLTNEERKQERQRSLNEWQKRWDEATTGRWTHRLIRSIQPWIERKHGETDFYLTQFLTGHGCYRDYLYKYGHDDETNCSFCSNSNENALHIFFFCPKYEKERLEIESVINDRVTPENIVAYMIESKVVWNRMRAWAAIAMQELRKKEWQRSDNRRMNRN
uniref:Putative 115 kDa protein in type-1 retrotransposable element R1DM n=1 Tax=Bactrocera dorsalis TaxID=27457 RepID=A0A034WR48_BACDO